MKGACIHRREVISLPKMSVLRDTLPELGSAEWCWTTIFQPRLPTPGIAGSGFALSATGRSR